ncbi:UNVERIFIED_CONTAM: hypothetical protein HDU68_010606 [Siphonaria sp. JEL0065]|nr:hypothetical protein HDU68_010606 [Siphonaria sp. JEL0065]
MWFTKNKAPPTTLSSQSSSSSSQIQIQNESKLEPSATNLSRGRSKSQASLKSASSSSRSKSRSGWFGKAAISSETTETYTLARSASQVQNPSLLSHNSQQKPQQGDDYIQHHNTSHPTLSNPLFSRNKPIPSTNTTVINSDTNPFQITPLQPPPSLSSVPQPKHIAPKDYIALSIHFHENTPYLDIATYYASLSAAAGNSVGLFLYGVALRHGLGVAQDSKLGVEILRRSADAAMGMYSTAASGGSVGFTDTLSRLPGNGAVRALAKKELGASLFELGNCYRNGWGVATSPSTALYYYIVASGLGEVDAHAALGDVYMQGALGVKAEKRTAAKYYRLAVEAGYKEPSLHWIYKEKWL